MVLWARAVQQAPKKLFMLCIAWAFVNMYIVAWTCIVVQLFLICLVKYFGITHTKYYVVSQCVIYMMYVKHSNGHIKLQWDMWQWSCWFLNSADTQQDTQEIVWQAEAQIHTRHWLCRDHCKRQDTCAPVVDCASHKQHTRHTPNQANIN